MSYVRNETNSKEDELHKQVMEAVLSGLMQFMFFLQEKLHVNRLGASVQQRRP